MEKFPSPLMIDIGCGGRKMQGFVGIDRFDLPGVDIVADIEKGVPLEDNSVDFAYAGHSLEHFRDLMAVMKEIYRVCKHGSQVCILAPYYEAKVNLANPYHYQVFNEHTPRFWTKHSTTPIPKEIWGNHPSVGADWGLSQSDFSDQKIDLRCVRMEFFYFEDYWQCSEEEKAVARKRRLDVCDQILYHLLVIKEPIEETVFNEVCQNLVFFEPPYITHRREAEKLAAKLN